MKKLAIVLVLLVSMISGCASHSSQWHQYAEHALQNEMLEVDHDLFDHVYAKSHSQSDSTKKVFITDLEVQHALVDFNRTAHSSLRESWILTQREIMGLQTMYRETLVNSLESEHDYVIVSTPEQADLIIVAEILELSPNAPKDSIGSREARVKYYTQGSGEITIAIDIYNQEEQLMQIVDTRDAGRTWELNTAHRNRHNTERVFKTWARHLTDLI